MAARHEGWHHLRVHGDKALAMRYLSEGRKWLGFLFEQRQNGGQQGSLTKRNAQGVVFRAEFAGSIPILTIDVTNLKKNPYELQLLKGFIVRPSPAADQNANVDKNHVLLTPNSEGWSAEYFDTAHRPAGITDKLYGLLLPNGIGDYGNVDWRNADQSMAVSWLGPAGRYGGTLGGIAGLGSTQVYCKGSTLFDSTIHGVALGVNGMFVYGACLRKAGTGLRLYAVLRSSGGAERLVRYRVTSLALKKAEALVGASVPMHLMADLVVDATSGELLFSRTWALGESVHPWFFNQSGTEARRIYADGGQVHEQVLSETLGVWGYVRTSTTVSKTYTVTKTKQPVNGVTYSYTDVLAGTSYTGNRSASQQMDLTWLPTTYAFANSEVEGVTEYSTGAPKIAVDFIDDVAVYARGFASFDSQLSSLEVSSSGSSNYVKGGSGTPDENSMDITVGYTASSETETATDGVSTDWLTLRTGATVQASGTMQSHYTKALTGDVVGTGPYDKSFTLTATSEKRSTSRTVDMRFLDLRYGIAYYTLADNVTVESRSISYSWSGTGLGPSDAPDLSAVPITLLTTTLSPRVREVVMIDGVEVLNEVSGGSETAVTTSESLSAIVSQFTDPSPGLSLIGALALPDSWHTNEIDVGTDAETDGSTSSSSAITSLSISTTGLDTSDDFADSGQPIFGAWLSAPFGWVYSQSNPTDRPTSLGAWSYAVSGADLDTVTGATGHVRYHPAAYFPPTFIGVSKA